MPEPFDPPPGQAQTLGPGLRRILAPNPSPMTWRGTNTYLLGESDLAVIDPGPRSKAHLEAILAALRPGQRISHIIVSHAHLDHAPLARDLKAVCGAPVYGFGPAQAGRSEVMQSLARAGLTGGEGVDTGFSPDQPVADGKVLHGSGWALEVIHTPGHMGNHICLGWEGSCFTADHVMGWASSLVSPPDGDLTDFMVSCQRLRRRSWHRFYPGHGAVIEDPAERLDWLISHRLDREAAVLAALVAGPARAAEIARLVYHDTPAALIPAATRNVLAHLIDLEQRNEVWVQGALHADSRFERASQ